MHSRTAREMCEYSVVCIAQSCLLNSSVRRNKELPISDSVNSSLFEPSVNIHFAASVKPMEPLDTGFNSSTISTA